MISSTFKTRRFSKIVFLQLLKNEIHVKQVSLFESKEFDISYEHIEPKKTVETKISFGLIVIFSLLTLTGILYFAWSNIDISQGFFICALLVFLIALVTKLRVVTIRTYIGYNIEIYFSRKNKDQVLAFADAIIVSANNYILTKFTKIDKDLPIEKQLSNLDYLKDKELITDETFEQLKDQLLGRDNKKSIGYR